MFNLDYLIFFTLPLQNKGLDFYINASFKIYSVTHIKARFIRGVQSGMLNGHMTWLNWLVTVICNGA